MDTATAFYHSCHPFLTRQAAQLGNPLQWLQKASDAGYAQAQAETVQLSFAHRMEVDMAKGLGSQSGASRSTRPLSLGSMATPWMSVRCANRLFSTTLTTDAFWRSWWLPKSC